MATPAEKKAQYLAQMTADPGDRRHGTSTGYSYGCRCESCLAHQARRNAAFNATRPSRAKPEAAAARAASAKRTAAVLEDVGFLVATGQTWAPDVARRVGIDEDALYLWLRDHGASNLAARLDWPQPDEWREPSEADIRAALRVVRA